jgi:hypothetical protein
VPPGSIKNYRDEFDPVFPNPRRGWHKRPRRENCLKVLAEYEGLDLELFAALIKSFADRSPGSEAETDDRADSLFANRLVTGLAAERYFVLNHGRFAGFEGCALEDTTFLGCGYDFKLHPRDADEFLVVEVKGLKGKTGSLTLTPKEYSAAAALGSRFFLFVVKNFQENPFHEVFRNPLTGGPAFRRIERQVTQVTWQAEV